MDDKRNDDAVDYLNGDDSRLISGLEALEYGEICVNKQLDDALSELSALKSQYDATQVANLIDTCKNMVIETVVGQFGLASVFLRCQDGGSVTTAHNFEKGVTATVEDAAKYKAYVENTDGSRPWSDVRKKGEYDAPLHDMRKEAFQTQDVIIDAYTGRPLSKDGRAHLDHIVSAKEIESNPRAHLFQTPEERAKMATDEANLAWTEGSANQSKGDQEMEDWLDKKSGGRKSTNEEHFGIDREKAMSRDKSARKHVKSTLNKAAFKKYSSELLVTGGKDAAKVAAYHALGIVMRELVQGVFLEVKHIVNNWGKCKPAEIYRRFKDRVAALCEKIKSEWKDMLGGSLWSGVQAFLSNIVVFLINLFATTLKKLVSMIRAGFVSLTEAVKILVNPPAGMPREEVAYQALKILTAGLIGAMSMGLSAGIEQLLNSIPGLQPLMLFVVPIANSTVSDILSVTLSALVGGVMSTVALYYMDKVFMTEKKARLSLCLAVQSGTVAQYQVISSWNCLGKAFAVIGSQTEDAGDHLMDARKERAEEKKKVSDAIGRSETALEELEELAKRQFPKH